MNLECLLASRKYDSGVTTENAELGYLLSTNEQLDAISELVDEPLVFAAEYQLSDIVFLFERTDPHDSEVA